MGVSDWFHTLKQLLVLRVKTLYYQYGNTNESEGVLLFPALILISIPFNVISVYWYAKLVNETDRLTDHGNDSSLSVTTPGVGRSHPEICEFLKFLDHHLRIATFSWTQRKIFSDTFHVGNASEEPCLTTASLLCNNLKMPIREKHTRIHEGDHVL